MPGLKIFDDLIKSKISSPFWRYYITSFIFIHWKIWLVMFGNDGDKINKISNIITPFYDTYKNWGFLNLLWGFPMFIANKIVSFAYISIYPAIVSIAILFCLRWVEKISAPWHEKHRKKVSEIVNNSQTYLESLKTKITHQKIALDHYIKKLEALQKNGDKSISDKLELFIIEYLLKNEKKQKLDELISNITSEITKEYEKNIDEQDEEFSEEYKLKLYEHHKSLRRVEVGNGIIYLETKKFIGSTENNNYAYNITSDGINRLRELYKNQDISKERAEIKNLYQDIILLSHQENIDQYIEQDDIKAKVKNLLTEINYDYNNNKKQINLEYLMELSDFINIDYEQDKQRAKVASIPAYSKEHMLRYCFRKQLIKQIDDNGILEITEKGKEFISN